MINWYEIPPVDVMKNNHCIRISEMSPDKIDILKEVQEKVKKMAEKFSKSLSGNDREPDRHKAQKHN